MRNKRKGYQTKKTPQKGKEYKQPLIIANGTLIGTLMIFLSVLKY